MASPVIIEPSESPLAARRRWVVFAGLALLVLLLVFNLRWQWLHDDVQYQEWVSPQGFSGGSIVTFLSQRLSVWTSRVAIEAALFFFINRVILWRLVTALAFWILVVIPPFLIARNSDRQICLSVFSGLLVLSIPSTVWFDAGFMATTINYLWALAAGLVAAVPLVLLLQRRWFSPVWYVAAIPAVLFAGSSEIVSALLAALFAGGLGVLIYQSRRVARDWIVPLLMLAFLIGMVGYHLFSPGNAARGQGGSWFGPTFFVLFERAYSSTLKQIFMSGYLIPLVFFVIIAVRNYQRRGLSVFTLVSLIPIIGSLYLRDADVPGTAGSVFTNLFTGGNLLFDASGSYIYRTLFPDNLLAFTVLTVLLLSAIVSIVSAFIGSGRWTIILVILAAGFAAKFIVANTIGEALTIQFHRTDLYFLVAFLLAALVAWDSYRPNLEVESESRATKVVGIGNSL